MLLRYLLKDVICTPFSLTVQKKGYMSGRNVNKLGQKETNTSEDISAAYLIVELGSRLAIFASLLICANFV